MKIHHLPISVTKMSNFLRRLQFRQDLSAHVEVMRCLIAIRTLQLVVAHTS